MLFRSLISISKRNGKFGYVQRVDISSFNWDVQKDIIWKNNVLLLPCSVAEIDGYLDQCRDMIVVRESTTQQAKDALSSLELLRQHFDGQHIPVFILFHSLHKNGNVFSALGELGIEPHHKRFIFTTVDRAFKLQQEELIQLLSTFDSVDLEFVESDVRLNTNLMDPKQLHVCVMESSISRNLSDRKSEDMKLQHSLCKPMRNLQLSD